jgi:hypothetical protein
MISRDFKVVFQIGCSRVDMWLLKVILAIQVVFLTQCVRATECTRPTVATETEKWKSMQAPHFPMEVLVSNPSGWIGLNHIFNEGTRTRRKMIALVPYLAPSFVELFPTKNALEALDNRSPIFYVHVQNSVVLTPMFAPQKTHILKLNPKPESRELEFTSGVSSLTMTPKIPLRNIVPLNVKVLSETLYQISPKAPMADGEYLITFGNNVGDGFEFSVQCSGK